MQIKKGGQERLKALRCAFPHTIPVLTGYAFLGLSYGFLMRSKGFSFIYPLCTSLFVFGGSLEYVLATLLTSTFAPLAAFFMALMIQARHIFYGLAMLDKYKGAGRKKLYLIYAMSDETFSVNCSADIPEGVDKGWFMFFVSILDQCYWVIATTLGGLLGEVIRFNTTGLEFVMTAMFVVIYLNQWMKDREHSPAIIGILGSLLCRLIFGADSFLIPSMLVIAVLLTLLRPRIEKGGEAA